MTTKGALIPGRNSLNRVQIGLKHSYRTQNLLAVQAADNKCRNESKDADQSSDDHETQLDPVNGLSGLDGGTTLGTTKTKYNNESLMCPTSGTQLCRLNMTWILI